MESSSFNSSRERQTRKEETMKTIVAVLALAFAALAIGCGGTLPQRAPSVTTQMPPRPPVVKPPAVVTPAVPPSKPAAVASTKPAAVVQATSPVQPSAFKSLQPFKQFAKGAGYGMARVYKPRTKAQFVALLRDSKQLRVSCERLVRQMAEVHGLPFENCEGAAAEIARNSDYVVVACRSGMFDRDNQLSVTNDKGSDFGVWSRACLAGETVLVYKNKPIASTMCANVTIPSAVPAPKSAPPAVATSVCPNGWTLTANAWSLKSMPEGLRKEIEARIAAAKERSKANLDAFATGDSVSRYGKRLREEVKVHAPVNADLMIQIGNRTVGTLKMVNGVGTFKFAEDPRSDVNTVTWPGFISPEEGVMKIFPREWQVCEPHSHGITP